jgi:hypothetical protein
VRRGWLKLTWRWQRKRRQELRTQLRDELYSPICSSCKAPIKLYTLSVFKQKCATCRVANIEDDESSRSLRRDERLPLYEDLSSAPYEPGKQFVRDRSVLGLFYGDLAPLRSSPNNTESIRDMIEQPTLHRDRFLDLMSWFISEPATLVEESLDGGVTRIRLAVPERAYRKGRLRSLGKPGVARLDCYIEPFPFPAPSPPSTPFHSETESRNYTLTVVHYSLATRRDEAVYTTPHESLEEATQAARRYLNERYREISPEAVQFAFDITAGEWGEDVSSEQAESEFHKLNVLAVGETKAEWVGEFINGADGSMMLALLYNSARVCDSREQLALLMLMRPDWRLDLGDLFELVKTLVPVDNTEE